MDCKECTNNYLRKIFMDCLKQSNTTEEGLNKFDRICVKSGDPRNPLTIVSSMSNNNCDDCKAYASYYTNFM